MRSKPVQSACALALAATLLLACANTAVADEGDFSTPVTAPEKALHVILQSYMREFEQPDSDTFAFWTQQRGQESAVHQHFEGKFARYKGKFTKGLVQAISKKDRNLRKTCDPADGLCGLDFDPVLCAQDILLPPHAYFTTRMEKANGWTEPDIGAAVTRAYVLYRNGSGDGAHRIDYQLEKERGVWKISGVRCIGDGKHEATTFNMR